MNKVDAKTRTHPQRGVALLYLVYFIYFFCGLTQCFEGVFLPEFKEYFRLNYRQQMYIVFAKNLPFLLSLTAAYVVRRGGYKRALALAMACYASGTLLLIPSLRSGRYPAVLCGFFIIGSGFTIHMVAGNPLMSLLGPGESASSRLNFGNALGALAQIIAPATLTVLIPASVISIGEKLVYIEEIFFVLGATLIVVACATFFFPNIAAGEEHPSPPPELPVTGKMSLWRNGKVVFGFITIFLVLGIEASLFSFFRNFVESSSVAGLDTFSSQRLFTIYFALFAAGRLLASWVQKKTHPRLHLRISLILAILCLAFVILAKGSLAVTAFLVLGFIVSIFFPTLYALIMDGLGELAPQASGLLTLGFLGCAIVPVAQGALADTVDLQRSFGLGILIYLFALAYTFIGFQDQTPKGRMGAKLYSLNCDRHR